MTNPAKNRLHDYEAGWRTLPACTLFDPSCARDAGVEDPVKVRLKNIRLERLRDFGDV